MTLRMNDSGRENFRAASAASPAGVTRAASGTISGALVLGAVSVTGAGLGAALVGDGNPAIRRYGPLRNLSVLCGGEITPMPAELLASQRMVELLRGWRSEYDFVVLDGPPILPVTDAVVLAQQCDAVLLIARHGCTDRKAVYRSYQTISRQLPQPAVLGTVLNAVPGRSTDFYEYYGYRSRVYRPAEGSHEARI